MTEISPSGAVLLDYNDHYETNSGESHDITSEDEKPQQQQQQQQHRGPQEQTIQTQEPMIIDYILDRMELDRSDPFVAYAEELLRNLERITMACDKVCAHCF